MNKPKNQKGISRYVKIEDYKVFDYEIPEIFLDFVIKKNDVNVTTKLKMVKINKNTRNLILDGTDIFIKKISIDDSLLEEEYYKQQKNKLKIKDINKNNFILKEATDDLSESQPTAGNIAGGLTTIEEKAFGNFQKIGNCKFIDVLEPAEEPTKGKGLYFMDTSSAAAECVTLQAAAGFNIHLFPTGQGNIVGNPIEPVVKLTANPLTVKGMGEHIDCDVSKILSREMNLSEAGDELIKTTLKVANGRLTCAEALGHREFVMTKLYRSA